VVVFEAPKGEATTAAMVPEEPNVDLLEEAPNTEPEAAAELPKGETTAEPSAGLEPPKTEGLEAPKTELDVVVVTAGEPNAGAPKGLVAVEEVLESVDEAAEEPGVAVEELEEPPKAEEPLKGEAEEEEAPNTEVLLVESPKMDPEEEEGTLEVARPLPSDEVAAEEAKGEEA